MRIIPNMPRAPALDTAAASSARATPPQAGLHDRMANTEPLRKRVEIIRRALHHRSSQEVHAWCQVNNRPLGDGAAHVRGAQPSLIRSMCSPAVISSDSSPNGDSLRSSTCVIPGTAWFLGALRQIQEARRVALAAHRRRSVQSQRSVPA
jgi:hypothetical protein